MFYEYVMTHFSQTAIEVMWWLSAACAVCTVAAFLWTVSTYVSVLLKKRKTNREHE